MKGFNRNRETRLRTSNKQYGRRDEEENRQKGMLNPDTADRYWRRLGQENYPINITHLFSTNAQVNNHNNTIYQASHTDKAQIKCIDIVVGDMSDALKKKMKEKIPDDPSKTKGLYTIIS